MKKFDKEVYLRRHGDMLSWRKLEDKPVVVYIQQKVRGSLYLYNSQEAIAAGCLHATDSTKNRMVTPYRCHVYPIGLGVGPHRIVVELYGKGTGISFGLGGSMHIFSKEYHLYGDHGIVGGQIALGAGPVFTDKFLSRDGVALTLMGSGAMRQGAFHKALNLAMLRELPVVFIVKNNHYVTGTSVERTASHTGIWRLGLGYKMPYQAVDSMHSETVVKAVYEAVEHAKRGDGPTLSDIKTHRYRRHSMSDVQYYRTKEEVEEYKKQDSITNILSAIRDRKYATDVELEAIDKRVKNLVAEYEKFTEESPYLEHHIMHDVIYDQENYPFLHSRL